MLPVDDPRLPDLRKVLMSDESERVPLRENKENKEVFIIEGMKTDRVQR